MTENHGVAGSIPAPGTIPPLDPPAVEIRNPQGSLGLLVICDHASNRIPPGLESLGLPAAEMDRHIAYDIGAAEVARRLADRLDCPAVLSGYSRLLVDCNRHPADPQCIPRTSDGTFIPGNHGLGEAEVAARVAAFHEPYHQAIAERLAHLWRSGPPPRMFSVHSFTPSMNGQARPWDVGVLWNYDGDIAHRLMESLRSAGLSVGDNEPYSGRQIAYTIERHAVGAGLSHGTVEIRQDHLEGEAGIARWTDLLAGILRQLMASWDLIRT